MSASTTRVISVRGKDRATLLADPSFVYTGRPCRGWPASPFGNPYRLYRPDLGRDLSPAEVVAAFEAWLATGEPQEPGTPKALARRQEAILRLLPDLRGKTLGCWCVDWDGTGEPEKPCHAVILARLAEAAPGDGGTDHER